MKHLDMSNMGNRHLVIAYAAVWIIQLSYAGWIAWSWKRDRPSQ
jgi:hypothetical protein